MSQARQYADGEQGAARAVRNRIWPPIVLLPASTWPMNTRFTCSLRGAEGSASQARLGFVRAAHRSSVSSSNVSLDRFSATGAAATGAVPNARRPAVACSKAASTARVLDNIVTNSATQAARLVSAAQAVAAAAGVQAAAQAAVREEGSQSAAQQRVSTPSQKGGTRKSRLRGSAQASRAAERAKAASLRQVGGQAAPPSSPLDLPNSPPPSPPSPPAPETAPPSRQHESSLHHLDARIDHGSRKREKVIKGNQFCGRRI